MAKMIYRMTLTLGICGYESYTLEECEDEKEMDFAVEMHMTDHFDTETYRNGDREYKKELNYILVDIGEELRELGVFDIHISRKSFEYLPNPMDASKFTDEQLLELSNRVEREISNHNFDTASDGLVYEVDDFLDEVAEKIAVDMGMKYYGDEEEEEKFVVSEVDDLYFTRENLVNELSLDADNASVSQLEELAHRVAFDLKRVELGDVRPCDVKTTIEVAFWELVSKLADGVGIKRINGEGEVL